MLRCGTRMGVLGCSGCRGTGAIGVAPVRGAAFHPGAGARGFLLLLPAGARPSRICRGIANTQRHRNVMGGSGTDCPPRCDIGTTKRKIYRNRGHFPRDGAGRVVAAWYFHRFLLLHPFFYSCPRPVAQGAAGLCPPRRAKTRSGTSTRQFVVKNNPGSPSPAALNRGRIFPAAGDP